MLKLSDYCADAAFLNMVHMYRRELGRMDFRKACSLGLRSNGRPSTTTGSGRLESVWLQRRAKTSRRQRVDRCQVSASPSRRLPRVPHLRTGEAGMQACTVQLFCAGEAGLRVWTVQLFRTGGERLRAWIVQLVRTGEAVQRVWTVQLFRFGEARLPAWTVQCPRSGARTQFWCSDVTG